MQARARSRSNVKTTFKTKGFAELERALAEDLPRATAKNVLTRTGKNAMKRIERKMSELAPKAEGTLSESMKTEKVKARRMRGGRYARSTGVEIQTGPAPAKPIDRANASWQEDGTVNMPPNPYARPAADIEGRNVVKEVRDTLAEEINKAKARIAKKAAKKG